jgi:hypothetical protein
MKATIQKYPNARSLLVLSSQLLDAFPLVQEVGLRWTGSFPSLWFLQALYPSGDTQGFRKPAEMGKVESHAWTRLIGDIRYQSPHLLLVERPGTNRKRLGTSGMDFLSYLRLDSQAAAVLDGYRIADSTGALTVWIQKGLDSGQ